jgi:hypothetical protein
MHESGAQSQISSSSKQLLDRIQNIRDDLNSMAENHNKKASVLISPFRRHNSHKTQNIEFLMGTASFPKIPINVTTHSEVEGNNKLLGHSYKTSHDSKFKKR